jgi:tetratricopeptide (TPR) repeat protein
MNEATGVDWFPALVVLGVGLALGVVAALIIGTRLRRARRRAESVPAQTRDLVAKRDALVRQLREMEDTASKRTPDQLAHERYALELEAADVLLALGERAPQESSKAARKPAARESRRATRGGAQRSGLRGFLWGTASATAILLVVYFVSQSSKPREMGGSVTGGSGTGGPAMSSAAAGGGDTEEAQLKAAVERNPNDIESHLGLAHVYVARQNWMGVWNETSEVLQREPRNPAALAYQGLVRLAMGQNAVAVDLLSKAVASDPDLVDGYVYLTLGYLRMGRARDAEATMGRASSRFPNRAPEFRRLLADMRKQEPPVAAAGSGGAPDPHAGVATPGETAAVEPARRSARGGRRVSGTIDIEPSARSKMLPGAVLFVFAREAGATEGPPVAVKRLAPTFPVAFELSEADSMLGQPFPDSLLIEARLDSDGDPTTRPPTDPKARADGVKTGRKDVRLLLR